ncbi:MAG: HAMP domain-containing sensor histidine kinase [Gordonia sp. (in: high G+C Gram-positive bacteria)]|uniref:sensor histidine kinase n=1 Tax=Gordonia sp. (in: high G+C Gram-positive bacteria) TaxID=84139 RepID=UPI003C71FC3A
MTESPQAPPGRRAWRFAVGTGLMLAMTVVVLATAGSALLVAWLMAPNIFHDHLHQAGIDQNSNQAMHVERAFTDAVGLSWGLAAVVSAILALALSWYLARRVQRTVTAVAASTAQIADGRYDTRVADGGLGREFDDLADAVNRLAQQLEASEATRRRMLSDLAHEMRTPLATIDSYLEAIDDGVRQPDGDTMAILHAGTDRLRRLAEDVSSVSRAQERALSVIPVRTTDRALQETAIAAAAQKYAAKGVALRLDDAPAVTIEVDPARMGQVLGNLLNNALRHTPTGGLVRVSSKQEPSHVKPWKAGSNSSGSGHVLISVSDTGEGIAPEHLAHVFDRFYRADTARDRDHGGSGIGLTIARALVEEHGGTLWAASDGPGAGAVFTMRLPVA